MTTSLETPELNPFEDVWLYVYYPTNGQISDSDDNFIRSVVARNDGVSIGSGTMMVEPYERDLQFRIKRMRAETVVKALESCGYKTKIMNIPPTSTPR